MVATFCPSPDYLYKSVLQNLVRWTPESHMGLDRKAKREKDIHSEGGNSGSLMLLPRASCKEKEISYRLQYVYLVKPFLVKGSKAQLPEKLWAH